MENRRFVYPFMLLLTAFFSTGAVAAQSEELKLAETYGCIACHSPIPHDTMVDGKKMKPLGPSFKEIADRFYSNDRDDKYQELYRIVKHGSSPYRSKWQGKISGLAMPPNDDTISDLDINRLLVWILTSHRPGK